MCDVCNVFVLCDVLWLGLCGLLWLYRAVLCETLPCAPSKRPCHIRLGARWYRNGEHHRDVLSAYGTCPFCFVGIHVDWVSQGSKLFFDLFLKIGPEDAFIARACLCLTGVE